MVAGRAGSLEVVVSALGNVRFGSWSCRNALDTGAGIDGGEETPSFFRASLCPHRGHERLDTHDVHHAGEIVGQYVKSHL